MRKVKGGDYLTTKEVGEQYQLSRQTLYDWSQDGKLQPLKFAKDKNYYWSVKELDRHLNQPVKVIVGGIEKAGD